MENESSAFATAIVKKSVNFATSSLAFFIVLGIVFVSCVAVAASEHDADMEHTEPPHLMEHSAHHHHLSTLPEALSSTAANYTIPELTLINMYGAEIALHNVLNGSSPVILNFIYTSCTAICPVMSATFAQVQQLLGSNSRNIHMVSISIDPEIDTPARLKQYASKFGVGSHWEMLTGTLEDSQAVQRIFGVYNGDKMNHTPVTFLKAQGAANKWVRLDGAVDATDIVKAFDRLNGE